MQINAHSRESHLGKSKNKPILSYSTILLGMVFFGIDSPTERVNFTKWFSTTLQRFSTLAAEKPTARLSISPRNERFELPKITIIVSEL